MKEKKYKIYIHRDIEGKVFYVGCTKDKHRPNRKYGIGSKNPKRTIEWYNRCLNKFTYTIVADNLTQELAYELEEFLITQYGRIGFDVDGILVNKTLGGKGSNGIKRTDEYKIKISKSNKGKLKGDKNPFYGKKHSQESLNKIREYNKGKKLSEQTKIKISLSNRGSKNKNSKKVICKLTNKIWDCISDCARENGINKNTLRGRLNGNLKNNTSFTFLKY